MIHVSDRDYYAGIWKNQSLRGVIQLRQRVCKGEFCDYNGAFSTIKSIQACKTPGRRLSDRVTWRVSCVRPVTVEYGKRMGRAHLPKPNCNSADARDGILLSVVVDYTRLRFRM
jgi:hypothetical protein